MSILKKPVHTALIPIAHIDKLRDSRRMQNTVVTVEGQTHPKLPEEDTRLPKMEIPKPPKGISPKRRVSLKVMYDRLPPLSPEKEPPCNTCAAACCRVFVVDLLKDEYESGIYDPYVVKLTEEVSTQLNSTPILVSQFMDTLLAASVVRDGNTRYMLDAQVGEPCPFLTNDNKCGIYEDRPLICRSYTCVGDSRITDEHRSGNHPMFDKFNGK